MPGSEQQAVRSEPPPSLLQAWSGCHAVACIQVQGSARRGPCHLVCCTQGLGSQAEAVAQLCTWVKGQPQLLGGEGPWLLHLAAVPQPKPREAAARALKLAAPALAPQTGRQQCTPCNAHHAGGWPGQRPPAGFCSGMLPSRASQRSGCRRIPSNCRCQVAPQDMLCAGQAYLRQRHIIQRGQPQIRPQAPFCQLLLACGHVPAAGANWSVLHAGCRPGHLALAYCITPSDLARRGRSQFRPQARPWQLLLPSSLSGHAGRQTLHPALAKLTVAVAHRPNGPATG